MATAVVVPALLALDREITSVAPRRTLPTWYRGDQAHAASPSGHNPDDTPGSKSENQDADSIPEIRAGDYRLPLNAQFTAEQLVQYLVKECRAGRITWIQYIIFNRRIWTAKNNWVTQKYTGKNPHDKHFHVSCKPETRHENNTKPVGLKNLLPVTQEDDVAYNESQMKAFPWQYNGRGLAGNDLTPEGNISTLGVLDFLYRGVRTLLAEQGLDEDEIAAMRKAAKEGTAEAMAEFADEIVSKVKAGLDPANLTMDAVETALRNVLIEGVADPAAQPTEPAPPVQPTQ